MSMYIDTHVHLNNKALDEHLDHYIKKALDVGVRKMLVVGFTEATNKRAIEIASTFDFIYASVGFHPTIAKDVTEEDFDTLEALLTHRRVRAIGECGMDLYWDDTFKDKQINVFERQIEMSKKHELPLIIHMRDADELTYEILKKHAPLKGVMHSYSGSTEMAEKFLALGLHISLSGPVTFKNAKKPKAVARVVPLDKLLVETDAPFLAPHPYRGKQNDSSFIPIIADAIANEKGIGLDKVKKATTKNADQLFNMNG